VTAAANPHGALVGVFYDDGIYLALGRSLAEGGGYRLQYMPGTLPGVHYPVLYPAFLAALWKLWPAFPANVALMRLANALLMGAFALLAARYLGRRAGARAWLAPVVIAAAATAIPVLAVTTVLFSEPLFLVLVVVACWAADAARDAEGRRGLGLAALAGLAAAAAILARSIGVAALAGVVLSLLMARRWGAGTLAAVLGMAAAAPWSLWARAHRAAIEPVLASNYGTYGDLVTQGGLSWLSLASLAEVGRPLGAIALPPIGGAARGLCALLALALLGLGLVELVKRAPAAGWMLAVYLVIVAVWPYEPSRFLWGALPWLGVAFVLGTVAALEGAARGAPGVRPVARGLALAGAAAVALSFGVYQARGFAGGAATATQRGISDTFRMVLPWIRERTPVDAVIATEDEALVWLYTGRRAVPSYLWRVRGRTAEGFGPDSLRAFLDRVGATHVLLTGPGSEAAPTIDALLERYPGYLRVVQVWPGQVLAFAIERRT
jgi:hypothetical protein